MIIHLLDHRRAAKFVFENPYQKHVIFISNPRNKFAIETSHLIPDYAKSCCELLFDDINVKRDGFILPNQQDIEKALEFAKDKAELIVTCQAGISRSASVAYVLASRTCGPLQALEYLNPNHHNPNELIVALASELLNLPMMNDVIKKWKQKANEYRLENKKFDKIKNYC